MKIIVLVKQVPDSTEIRVDKVTGTLIRAGVPSIINPDDLAGVEEALKIKEATGAHVTVISMGPPQASGMLKELYGRGVDECILITDRAFAGADTCATSSTLAAAIEKVGYDLIIGGRQAIDGDTAQVGPEMAEHLGIPQVTGALKVALGADGRLLVERENESSCQTLAVTLPAVVTVTKSEKEPRFASIKGKMKARKAEIPVMGAAELEIDPKVIGLSGSPTKVLKIFTPSVPQIESEIINEEDTDKAVDMLIEKLVQAKIITH